MKGIFLLIGILAASAYAADKHDYLSPQNGTQPVALTGGDTPLTSSVACATGSTATLLVAARTDRSRRRVCFQNTGNIAVSLGTSTLSASDFYVIGESTTTYAQYCTSNSSAYYCGTKIGSSAMSVVVIEETQSIP